MNNYITDRIGAWMTVEPLIGLLMIIACIVLFINTLRKKGETKPATFWQWCVRIIESAAVSLLFMGLLWSFRAILNNNLNNFSEDHGRISQVNYDSLQTIWGAPVTQRELSVVHTIEVTKKVEIPRAEDSDRPPLYKTVTEREIVDQNSILAFNGIVNLNINTRKKGSANYSGYDIALDFNYEIINDSDKITEALFKLPLPDTTMFNNFFIKENGEDISSRLRFSAEEVKWKKMMKPGEKIKININYNSRGLDFFYYQIPYKREIKNFSMKIICDKLPVEKVDYPYNCLTPSKLEKTPDGKGVVLSWELDNAITTSGMGVALETPKQPGETVRKVLYNSPYALMYLIITVCITLLIFGIEINFLEISLLSAVYCLVFFVMSSISDFFIGFWGSLVLGGILTIVFSYMLYRKHPKKIYILSLTAFFALIYPLSGLFPDYLNTVNGIVSIGIIVYVFLIALYSRIIKKENN